MINPCSGCKASCCSSYLVTVTSFDVLRIAKNTGKKPGEFAYFHPAKILSYDWDTVLFFFENGKFPDYCLLALKSWPCIFLKESRCSIHDISPLVCKRYPFNRDGELIARHCPVISRALFLLNGPKAGEMLPEIEKYKKIVKEWNESKGKRKDCMGFLMERSADFKE